MIKTKVLQILKHKSLYKLLIKKNEESASDIYFVNIDPKLITHISLLPENASRLTGSEALHGAFYGGFDILKTPFKRGFMYLTVQQLINGEDWESTLYYQKLLKYKEKSETFAHYRKLKHLIETISSDGYLSQFEMKKTNQTISISKWKVPRHEMVIGLDRKGRFFRIRGGRHRLAVAQNIGVKEIPAILMLYHQSAVDHIPQKSRIIRGEVSDYRPFGRAKHVFEQN
jgi:hypothetical protein